MQTYRGHARGGIIAQRLGALGAPVALGIVGFIVFASGLYAFALAGWWGLVLAAIGLAGMVNSVARSRRH
jgi:hypothetical protein